MDTLLPFDLSVTQVTPNTLAMLRAVAADQSRPFSRLLLNAWISHMPVCEAEDLADDFLLLLATFPQSLNDPEWQAELLQRWQRLSNAGVPPDWLFILCNHSLDFIFANLTNEGANFGRMQAELIGALRRGLLAICTALLRAHPLLHAPQLHQNLLELDESGNLLTLENLLRQQVDKPQRESAFLILGLANAELFRHFDHEWSQRFSLLVVQAVSQVLRPYDALFVLHGSRGAHGHEWGILLGELQTVTQVHMATIRIQEKLKEQGSHLLAGLPPIQPVFGAALSPVHGDSAVSLLHAANLALDSARRQQLLCEIYDPSLAQRAAEQACLAAQLTEALGNDRLKLYHQPQVDLLTGKPVGVESLLRWQLPNGRFIPPPTIIELIETQNLRVPFNRWLFHAVLRTLDAFQKNGLGHMHISFNLTADDLLDEDLPEVFSRELQLWGMSAEHLTIELTEGALVSDFQRAARIMQRLREIGFSLALDDFGTGFSSLSYLRNLPLSELKIDRMFVYQMLDSPRDREIVQSTIDLAHKLGLFVVAEGMEDHPTARQLGRMGCNWAQGYAMSPPLNQEACIHWLRHWDEYDPTAGQLEIQAETEWPHLPVPKIEHKPAP